MPVILDHESKCRCARCDWEATPEQADWAFRPKLGSEYATPIPDWAVLEWTLGKAWYRGAREAGFTVGCYTVEVNAPAKCYRTRFTREHSCTVSDDEYALHLDEFLTGTVLYAGCNIQSAVAQAEDHYARIRRSNAWIAYMRHNDPPI